MDIVDRLRDMQGKKYRSDWAHWVQTQCSAAATEIEQLRARGEKMRTALTGLLEIEDARIATGAFIPNEEATRRIDGARDLLTPNAGGEATGADLCDRSPRP